MKWKGMILIATVAVVAYLWWPDSSPPQNEVSLPTSAALATVDPPPADAELMRAPVPADNSGSTTDPEQQAAADELELEIKTLMVEFDRYRHDSQQRAQIQSQIDVLMAEYNEIILPIALSKIKEGN